MPLGIERAARVHDVPLPVPKEMAKRSDVYSATLAPTRNPEAAGVELQGLAATACRAQHKTDKTEHPVKQVVDLF